MHPKVDPELEQVHKPIEMGLPASPGGAIGRIVFSGDVAEKWHKQKKKVILVKQILITVQLKIIYVFFQI